MKQWLYLILGLLIWNGCDDGSTETPANQELQQPTNTEKPVEYELERLPGAAMEAAYRYNEEGRLIEEGFMMDGQKAGTWITFYPDGEYPAKMVTYVGGNYHGPYYEFNERGQIQLKAHYRNNKLDGDWATYRFGRPLKTAQYKNGELHGLYREYELSSGNLQKEVSYQNGKQHGHFRVYDKDGRVVVEYEYQEGEKLSGGITE